ncbi:hypothetical protein [Falsiroseomonas selenitidurans]|uniref:Uncharacterized protein n=1 Tax=Falsiroseomonas selenitidurans TaxID=2716335 RepID=A0ABX1E8I3_9PROT|nr:hypothetical protein [Falsiroseomonas selenitidurans]NKC33504.1 hypothetical protein [Falsiroseomonas selenitidurans]
MAVGILTTNALAAAALTVPVGAGVSSMPVANLQDAQPRLRARFLADSGAFAILADAGAAVEVGVVLLGSTTLQADDTVRLRGSTADATGAAGDALDVTLTATASDAGQGQVVRPVSPSAACRYLRIDITCATGSVRDIGLLVAGPLLTLDVGIQGLTEGRVPFGQALENAFTGTRHDVPAPLGDPRFIAGALTYLTQAEYLALRDDIFAGTDALLVPNTADTQAELNRRSVWGRLTRPRSATGFAHSAALRRSLQLNLVERL